MNAQSTCRHPRAIFVMGMPVVYEQIERAFPPKTREPA